MSTKFEKIMKRLNIKEQRVIFCSRTQSSLVAYSSPHAMKVFGILFIIILMEAK